MKNNAKLVLPVGGNSQKLNVITKKHDDNFDEDIYEDVSFVPMLPGKSEDGNDIWKKN